MKIGFTGTQRGLSKFQKESLTKLFSELIVNDRGCEFHQGDCVGADQQANKINLHEHTWCRRIGHPPTNDRKRAWCSVDEWRIVKPYLERNHDIVDETEVLIACPKSLVEEQRSGTWATVRYAKSLGKEIYIVWPNGEIKHIEETEELVKW